jgi:hypothetical protein
MAKKLQTTSLPTPQLAIKSAPSSPMPPSPVASAPSQATVDSGEKHSAPPVRAPPAPSTGSSPHGDKPRELRRERDEEMADGESARKRRKITPPPATIPSPSVPAPVPSSVVPVSGGAVPLPEVAETIVHADKFKSPPASHPEVARHLESTPDSAPPPQQQQQQQQPVTAPAPEQRRPEEANAASSAVVPRKIGIQHIQLVYETVGQTLQCRMCLCVVSHRSSIYKLCN